MTFFRILHPLLLIAGILACPQRCMAAAGTAGESPQQTSHCACCQPDDEHCPPQNDPDAPNKPVDDDCADCLCKGAVMGSDGSKISLDAALLPNELAVWSDFAAPPFQQAATRSRRHTPLLALKTGRQVRLFVESLLL